MAKKTISRKKSVSKTVKSSKPVVQKSQTPVSQPAAQSRLVREKAQDVRQLVSHGIVYIAVNIFLIFINFTTSRETLWFFWVLIGWGIGLAFHWLDVINYSPINEKWVQEEAKKIVQSSDK